VLGKSLAIKRSCSSLRLLLGRPCNTRAVQRVLPVAWAAALVHRTREVALSHRRMETVAERHPRRQEPAATRCRV